MRAMREQADAQRQVIEAVVGALSRWMNGNGWTRSRLAKMMGRPESKIASVLSGRNITLCTLGTLLWIMGAELEVKIVRRGKKTSREEERQRAAELQADPQPVAMREMSSL